MVASCINTQLRTSNHVEVYPIFSEGTWKVRYTNQIRTRYRNWRTTSATQLQPSKSLCYIGYTSTWWQHDCWLTAQTLYTIYVLTPEWISPGHVQNGKWATFSWPTLYNKVELDGVVEGVMMTIKIPLFKHYLVDWKPEQRRPFDLNWIKIKNINHK